MTNWRRDYPHPLDAFADDGKSPRFPGGRCVRADCWPCTIARLDAGDVVDWPGRARMASARQEAGVPLDELDIEALARA